MKNNRIILIIGKIIKIIGVIIGLLSILICAVILLIGFGTGILMQKYALELGMNEMNGATNAIIGSSIFSVFSLIIGGIISCIFYFSGSLLIKIGNKK